MASKLSKDQLDRTKTDFDLPTRKPLSSKVIDQINKSTGKGNPNGRPPSENPRLHNLHIRLSDEDAETLEEAARLTKKTKTAVIVEGIKRVYNEAAAQAWKAAREDFKDFRKE